MSASSHQAQLLRLALSVDLDLPGHEYRERQDLKIEVQPEATVQDLVDAVLDHLHIPRTATCGLIRTMVDICDAPSSQGRGYLVPNALVSDYGLVDGVILRLADRSATPAPDLALDTGQADDDLFLIDERGTHRGRVTRLPSDERVFIGTDPPGQPCVLVDDATVAAHAVTLINRGGRFVQCVAVHRENLYLSGAAVTGDPPALYPGSSISIRPGDTDLVSFIITTKAALRGKSPVGKVQFDTTARPNPPVYRAVPEQLAKLPDQPAMPDVQPFPIEQVAVPLAIVGVLVFATHSLLAAVVTPFAAILPIVSYFRNRKQVQERYQKDRGKWVDLLKRSNAELTRAAAEEENNLRLEYPPPEIWARRAYRRLAGLWEHSPERPSFLRIRLGLGQVPSRYGVSFTYQTDRDDPDFKTEMDVKGRKIDEDQGVVAPQLFNAPVTIDLQKFHLGLVGPLDIVDLVAVAASCCIILLHGWDQVQGNQWHSLRHVDLQIFQWKPFRTLPYSTQRTWYRKRMTEQVTS